MPKKDSPASPDIFKTTVPEDSAQIALLNIVAGLKGLAADLRSIYNTLGEPENDDAMSEDIIPESPAHFIRSAIECVFDDLLDPLVFTLGRAALITPEALRREWQERQRPE